MHCNWISKSIALPSHQRSMRQAAIVAAVERNLCIAFQNGQEQFTTNDYLTELLSAYKEST